MIKLTSRLLLNIKLLSIKWFPANPSLILINARSTLKKTFAPIAVDLIIRYLCLSQRARHSVFSEISLIRRATTQYVRTNERVSVYGADTSADTI